MSTSEQPKPPVTGATRAQAATAPATKPATKPAAVRRQRQASPPPSAMSAKSVGDVGDLRESGRISSSRSRTRTIFRCFGGALAAAGLTLESRYGADGDSGSRRSGCCSARLEAAAPPALGPALRAGARSAATAGARSAHAGARRERARPGHGAHQPAAQIRLLANRIRRSPASCCARSWSRPTACRRLHRDGDQHRALRAGPSAPWT